MTSRALRFLLVCLMTMAASSTVAQDRPDWIPIDYSALVDSRQLSHSGESVEDLLAKLQGRPLPAAGERPGDRLRHVLLDRLLEPYAFILSDTLDSLDPQRGSAIGWVELGSLWLPGERQPAWVELLRSRQLVVESNGSGRLRLVLPADNGETRYPGRGAPQESSSIEAEAAYRKAWPIVRHIAAAEQRRLGGDSPVELQVSSYVYRHSPERSQFVLGREPFATTVAAVAPDGRRPPLGLTELERFLASGLQLEGARLEPDGGLRLFGSQTAERATMLGTPLTLADLAVAYRAIFHGGLAEPYMSLDRGFSPQAALVNYGGRLRDTRLGWVSLLCDIRFKTFSLGLGIREGDDLRESVRRVVDGFQTHIERFSADADSASVGAQQTRLWFYPDTVDLTVAAEGDVLAMRRPRMAAASERVGDGGGGGVPPWTAATVGGINADYDRLAQVFPELRDLDQVVRLLSLFTWLRQAQLEGLTIPDLDVLLNAELPGMSTPRTYPQLLTFTALPAAGSKVAVDVFDRVPFGEALDRLNPTDRPGPAHARLERAIAALDPDQPESRQFMATIEGRDRSLLSASAADQLAFGAERLRMHKTVIGTPGDDVRERVAPRVRAGEGIRVYSVAIGGLDLDMKSALARAEGRKLGFGATSGASAVLPASLAAASAAGGRAAGPRAEWAVDPVGMPRPTIPAHGPTTTLDLAYRFSENATRIETLYDIYGVAPRRRLVEYDTNGVLSAFGRFDEGRRHRYRLLAGASGRGSVRAEINVLTVGLDPFVPPSVDLGDGLATFQIREREGDARIPIRLQGMPDGGTPGEIEGTLPRAELQRLILGPTADLAQGRVLGGLGQLPPQLGPVSTLMLLQQAANAGVPWGRAVEEGFGETRADTLARSLNEWWSGAPPYVSIVGTHPTESVTRWR
ncbi:MAG: hypothetical protein OEV00_10395, partial [Acidobacteriota bacterium]|nr:hypothetical protein [Acidobacteriota bacterium]